MEIFDSKTFSVNGIFWLIHFKMSLFSHCLLLVFISFRLSLVIDACLSSISVILLEQFRKDLFKLPVNVYYILNCDRFFKTTMPKISFVDLSLSFALLHIWVWLKTEHGVQILGKWDCLQYSHHLYHCWKCLATTLQL